MSVAWGGFGGRFGGRRARGFHELVFVRLIE